MGGKSRKNGGGGDAAREASEGWAKTNAGCQRLKAAARPQTTQAQAAVADQPNDAALDDFFQRRDGRSGTSKKPFVASFVAEAPASRGLGSSGGSSTAAVAVERAADESGVTSMAEPTPAPAPEPPLAPPSAHDGGAVAGNPVAIDKKNHRLLPYEYTVEVPRHAIGHVIGMKGVHIKALQRLAGVTSCRLQKCKACGSKCEEGCNRPKTLTAKGTVAEALQLVEQRVTNKMGLANKALCNQSRQHHTHDLRPNGSALRRHDVHKAVPKTPSKRLDPGNPHAKKKMWKKREAQSERERGLREAADGRR